MDYSPDFTRTDWKFLRSACRAGKVNLSQDLLSKIKAGKRRFTEDSAIEIHLATKGVIPCWRVRPDLWAPGQFPPALEHLAVS